MKIKGSLDLSESSIESLGNLEEITFNFRGLILIKREKLKTLGKLTKVLFFINASYCENLISLSELSEVSSFNLKSLGRLKIANEIILKDSGITLEYIRKQKPYLLSKCRWSNLWT